MTTFYGTGGREASPKCRRRPYDFFMTGGEDAFSFFALCKKNISKGIWKQLIYDGREVNWGNRGL